MVQDRPPTPPKKPRPSPDRSENSFDARLAKARLKGSERRRRGINETSAFGIATRLVAELVSGLVIGGGIGWLLDRWLGTEPWLLVVFFILGAGAGIANVIRAANQMNARQMARQEDDRAAGSDKGPENGRDDDRN